MTLVLVVAVEDEGWEKSDRQEQWECDQFFTSSKDYSIPEIIVLDS